MFSVDQVWIEDVVTDDLNNRLFGKVKGHSFSQKQQKPKSKDGAMLVNNTQLKDKVEDKGKLRKRKLGKPKDDLVLPKTKKLSKGGSEQTTFRQSVNRDCIPAVDKKKKLKKKRKREESDGNVKHTLNKNVVGTLQDTNLVLDVNEDCAKDNVKRKKKNRRKKKNASDQGSVEQLNSAESDYQTKCDGGMVRQKQTTEVFTGNDLRSKKASGMNSESARRNGPRKKLPFAPGKLTAALKINASYRPNDASDEAGVPELISANRTSSSTAKQQNVNLSTRDKMKSKLEAARFRYLNEQLYTSSSREAVNMFREDPHAFNVYHAGFQSQVACWPVNPVDQIINYIKSR